MLKPIKERELHLHSKIEIYRNLNQKCFSIRDYRSKLVLSHADGVVVHSCKMKVSEAGRYRVIRDKRKNVHASIIGEFGGEYHIVDTYGLYEVYYDPYKYDSFVLLDREGNVKCKIGEAETIYFYDGKAYLIN